MANRFNLKNLNIKPFYSILGKLSKTRRPYGFRHDKIRIFNDRIGHEADLFTKMLLD